MDKKIKMLVVPSDRTGVGYFRSLAPHLYMAEHYGDLFDIDIVYEMPTSIPLDKFLKQYDLIHFHKQLDKNCEIINLIKFLDIKCIMDVDDHWDLGKYHPMSLTAEKENWKGPIIEHLKLADYVTTTTPFFKKEIMKYNKNVIVIPNAINPEEEQFIPKPTKSDKLRFGIICGSSHFHDISILDGIVKQLSKDVLDKIQFVLCGFDTKGTRTIYYLDTGQSETRDIEPHESVWFKYEKILTDNYSIVSEDHKKFLLTFAKQMEYPNINEGYRRCWTKPIHEYATHYNNIDVLLVPLKETPFNMVKSQLKVIEAGFFSKAIIAQNFGPYTIDLVPMIEKGGKINDNGNSLLVDSSKNHKQWAKYITRLVNDREMLSKLQHNLHETVKDKYSLSTVCEQRVKEYLNILGKN
jgi:glycosyltransferase involved in cell wall biosynthesis